MPNILSPLFADILLGLMYLMLAAAVGVMVFSVVRGFRNRRQGADVVNGVPAGKIGWAVVAALLLCLCLTFLFGSSAPVKTNGVWYADTFWLKVADMFIFTSIIFILGCFVSAIVSRFRS